MRYLLIILFFNSILWAKEESLSNGKYLSLKTLYSSLDPLSLSQYLAFYELYPDTPEGKAALERAWKLLRQGTNSSEIADLSLPKIDIQPIVSLVTRQPSDAPVKLSEEELAIVEKLGSHFPNRKLKGCSVWTKEEVLALPPEEIDLGRGLLMNQFDDSKTLKDDVRQYEAVLDLMALQIFVRLPENASSEQKIRAINHFIFQEMQFRFPPHALHAKDIDLYTFLPSVLDSRQGVCLGVSILYLCLAQRLDLSLEIITPPGHIYVRYVNGDNVINIETTARGINLPSEVYLGIDTRKLQLRNIKEVIGMAFTNQASVFWSKQDYDKAISLYEKARPYLPNDPWLDLLQGINYLIVGKISEGKTLLKHLQRFTFDHAVSAETLADDYLGGNIDVAGIKSIFLPVDETRNSVLEKQEELKKILHKYPRFRAGLLQLAVTYLQLGRSKEAQEILERYHAIDRNSSVIEYYLAAICIERFDFNQAWKYYKNAEAITVARNHQPKALKALRAHLQRVSPNS